MKKKTLYVTLGIVVAVATLGTGLYFATPNTEETTEVVEDSENPIALDGDSASQNIVLDDTASEIKGIQEEMKAEDEEPTSNGTGEYAPIETSYDLTYEQQVAEENGTAMPTETIVMYALTTCNIRQNPSTDAPVLGQFKKGEEVEVAVIEDGWATVVLDDGTGHVRADLLGNTKPVEAAPVEETASNGESASSDGAVTEPAAGSVSVPVEEDPTIGKTEGGTSGLTPEQLAILESMGCTLSVDEVVQSSPNQHQVDRETSVDISNVTLH